MIIFKWRVFMIVAYILQNQHKLEEVGEEIL